MNNIFTFYRKDNWLPIIIVAETYIEAINTIYELDNYANQNYNLCEYKREQIDPMPYLNIDKKYWCLPYIMNETQYNEVLNKIGITKKNIKYNCTILRKDNQDILSLLNKINECNNDKETIKKREDQKLLNTITEELNQILQKYVYEINNQDLRNRIYYDVYSLLVKYKSELNKSMFKGEA